MLDKLRSKLVHFGPSMMSVPVKLAPFALKRQVLEQVLSWQFRQALADGELEFLEGRWLSIHQLFSAVALSPKKAFIIETKNFG